MTQQSPNKARRVRRARSAEGQTAVRSVPARSIRATRRVEVTEEQLKEEYQYVLSDLRLFFVVTFLLFGLLITLNILLPHLNI